MQVVQMYLNNLKLKTKVICYELSIVYKFRNRVFEKLIGINKKNRLQNDFIKFRILFNYKMILK